jgi:hypothetical protein
MSPRRNHRPRGTAQSRKRKRLSCGTVEKTPCLNINELYRGGAFKPGINAFPAISLRHPELQYLRAGQSGIELTFCGGIRQAIAITWSHCFVRKYRPWFCCPSCQRRVGRLYIIGLGVICRKCANLRYACQRKNSSYRCLITSARIRMRFGQASIALPFPDKPPYMHKRTYDRLRRRALRLEARLKTSRARSRPPDYSQLLQR